MLAVNSAAATEFQVTVSNIDVARGGQIIVFVFGEEGFPKAHDQAVVRQVDDQLQPTMNFTFVVEMGEIAVKVLHDENKDGKVTKNWTGIYPAEGLGFSNDQTIGLTGPPKYRNARVSKAQFRNGLNITIQYP